MNVLDLACELGRKFEGIEDGNELVPGLQPYRDPVGLWTIGYGHLLSHDKNIPCPDITWSMEEAEDALQKGMNQRLIIVQQLLVVKTTEKQQAALTDFAFNLGVRSLLASTLLRKLNRGDFGGASAEFPKWKFAGGRVLNGLVRRRAAERALFDEGD